MFYTIYKITNKFNNKIYIGKHQTKDLNDGYMGSGKQLRFALNKYGIENFEKEILFQFDNEADMNSKEAELVTKEFCLREDTYNLCPGGNGGFGHINLSNLGNIGWKHNGKNNTHQINGGIIAMKNPENRRIVANNMKEAHKAGKIRYDGFKDKKHTDITKKKMSDAQCKDKNSQYGTMWIHSIYEKRSIKINKSEMIPEGWYKGRMTKDPV